MQWHLLTSQRVRGPEEAQEVVGQYLQRWKVEDYFRVLKTGCGTQRMGFRTAQRMQRAVAIHSVIAWRLMVMTLLGRQVPDCDPGLLYTEAELGFLRDYARQHGQPCPDQLGKAAPLVAHLGGYRGRNNDLEPGCQMMWMGYDLLTEATLGHQTCLAAHQDVLQGKG